MCFCFCFCLLIKLTFKFSNKLIKFLNLNLWDKKIDKVCNKGLVQGGGVGVVVVVVVVPVELILRLGAIIDDDDDEVEIFKRLFEYSCRNKSRKSDKIVWGKIDFFLVVEVWEFEFEFEFEDEDEDEDE